MNIKDLEQLLMMLSEKHLIKLQTFGDRIPGGPQIEFCKEGDPNKYELPNQFLIKVLQFIFCRT